jgi:hypothetical protein
MPSNLNRNINKAIATTVVVTTIGFTSTVQPLGLKAAPKVSNLRPDTYIEAPLVALDDNSEVESLTVDALITGLLKQGNYKEAREIKKSLGIQNPLMNQLRSFRYYAVSVAS